MRSLLVPGGLPLVKHERRKVQDEALAIHNGAGADAMSNKDAHTLQLLVQVKDSSAAL